MRCFKDKWDSFKKKVGSAINDGISFIKGHRHNGKEEEELMVGWEDYWFPKEGETEQECTERREKYFIEKYGEEWVKLTEKDKEMIELVGNILEKNNIDR